MRSLELLAPAKNTEIARAAILHGADAVYIGAPKFGARAAAGNSTDDLAELVQFAHLYRAKVYVTLNTILTDSELKEAKAMIQTLYDIGVDALIVQDTGLFEADLPPIALHASTQCDNRSLERVRFWEQIGCEQVVLARELSLDEIRTIRQGTDVRLEAFVHGALCVSYSGQCYAGQALCGRSANRGVCPQICRLPFDLQDAQGHSLGRQHWLSLKDLDTHRFLPELIEAGVDSFKIEGRLKDIAYVKNITALYSGLLDAYIAAHPGQYRRASDGVSRPRFTPQADKSFNRMGTDYFLHGRHNGLFNPVSPKSMGEPVGPVCGQGTGWLEIATQTPLNNGDGFCYVQNGQLRGLRANRAEGRKIFAPALPTIANGTQLYRNEDTAFERLLQGDSAERRITVDWQLDGIQLSLTDGERTVSTPLEATAEPARQDPKTYIESQLRKLGDTAFEARSVDIRTDRFIPASVLSEARRRLCRRLEQARTASLPAPTVLPQKNNIVWPQPPQGYRANLHNQAAEAFYHRHGVSATEPSLEALARPGVPVMYCRHCLKYELGACTILPDNQRKTIAEPL
ncbi:MAG: U32 family peptidase, partial [Paludibacteraceae bacterium]|nr:U32 family peptidase [Paludibacteraceae bacterium]